MGPYMDRWKLLVALTALSCPGVVLIGSAQDQLTIDATKQVSSPPMGRGPFPGSPTPGHSPGLPIRLVLQIPTGDLRADEMTLVDFLITNVGTKPITLPVSVDCRTEPTDILILWFSSAAIKDQYLIDQQTGHPVKIEMVETSAQLCGRSSDPQGFHTLAPNETIRVHALSPPMNPGTHSFTGHAARLRVAHGTSELVGTSDAEPATNALRMTTR
jgi:hypothetical protein